MKIYALVAILAIIGIAIPQQAFAAHKYDHAIANEYIIDVLLSGQEYRDHYYSISISSLQNNVEISFADLQDCWNRYSYNSCLEEHAKWLYMDSIFWNRLEDTAMQIATNLSQLTVAYDLCIYEGNSQDDCHYILSLQNYFVESAEQDYKQYITRYASVMKERYRLPSYEVTWTTDGVNVGRDDQLTVVILPCNGDECTDSRYVMQYTPVLAFSYADIDIGRLEHKVHDLINEYRENNGLAVLQFDVELSEVARFHSKEMATYRFLSHINNDGEGPTDRAEELGYDCEHSDGYYIYSGIGENILYSYAFRYYTWDGELSDSDWMSEDEIAEDIVQSWISSTGHRENLLTEHYIKSGVGITINEHAEIVATQDFC